MPRFQLQVSEKNHPTWERIVFILTSHMPLGNPLISPLAHLSGIALAWSYRDAWRSGKVAVALPYQTELSWDTQKWICSEPSAWVSQTAGRLFTI